MVLVGYFVIGDVIEDGILVLVFEGFDCIESLGIIWFFC